MKNIFKNKIFLSVASLILFILGGLGIYRYLPFSSNAKVIWCIGLFIIFLMCALGVKLRKYFYYLIFWGFFIYSSYIIFHEFAPDFSQIRIIWAGPIAGVLALLYAALKINDIMLVPSGSDKMKEISNAIHKGAMTFLKKEYLIMSIIALIVAFAIVKYLGIGLGVCFLVGAITSALAGFIGMSVSTRANVKTAYGAQTSLNKAFKIAYSGGLVMGLCVVGLAMIAIPVLYFIFKDPQIISGFGFGASFVALFARVGGGIFTKAADIGADLVGKIEENIPEDDPRNPAVISDNVGDNVGDVAGMGADLFESYAGIIIAAITLGSIPLSLLGAFMPLTLAASGILCSIIASVFVRTRENINPIIPLQTGSVLAILMFVGISYYLIEKIFLPEYTGIFSAVLTGVIAGCVIGFSTQYYTSPTFPPVKSIAKSTVTGAATTVISGVKAGMTSTFFPILVISVAMLVAFWVIGGMGSYNAGAYGVSLAAIGMLSTVAMIVAIDAYGPIADNAGGIAQMAGLDPEVRKRTDKLDAVGNTTAAIGKGFAIGSAALTSICLLVAFALTVDLEDIDLLNPFVMSSIIFGGCLPFIFSALSMGAVGRAAEKMVKEVRRQFNENPKILTGEEKPDYNKCVKISTNAAIFEMFLPSLIAILAPIFVSVPIVRLFGKTLGAQALGGMLMGAIVSGVSLAIMMANSGGAWDNAKKLIEEGKFGGKDSSSYESAIIGDTVGDPFKDTSGPSLNILIKLMSIIALVCAGLFMA